MAALKKRGGDRADPQSASVGDLTALRHRVKALEVEVQELRQLNRRLADVVDVVSELLVPALDRDDERVAAALERLRAEESGSSPA
jgi:hypothetical protein